MCGRYYLHSGVEALTWLVGDLRSDILLQPRYNIAPTQPVPIIRADAEGGHHLALVRWGLIPAWSKGPDSRYSMINARIETVADKPAYRAAFRYRRCILPADGFYEWQAGADGKQPHVLRRADHRPLALAGIWEHWQSPDGSELESCAILVGPADDQVRPIHERMPVILAPEQCAAWLDRHQQRSDEALALLLAAEPPALEIYPVRKAVNNPRNDAPDLVEPSR
jgi:putative SOS response-associated peptidase YedK